MRCRQGMPHRAALRCRIQSVAPGRAGIPAESVPLGLANRMISGGVVDVSDGLNSGCFARRGATMAARPRRSVLGQTYVRATARTCTYISVNR